MYQVEAASQVIAALRRRLFGRAVVPGTVVGLGWTSFFTDVSSEMVASVLPVYVLVSLQLSPLLFGVLDGLQQGASALVRLLGGYFADRWRRHKEVALVGYGLSALTRLGLVAVGSAWTGIAAMILTERIGKGIRTAPRDALISLSVPRERLGTAFGVHRALDTAGAMLGPVLAFALLALLPGRFDAVFVVSFCIAVLGVGVLWLFVAAPAAGAAQAAPKARPSLRQVAALLARGPLRRLALAGTLLGLCTISDGFLYLSIQQKMQLDVGFFPLLFVLTAAAYMLLSVPVGRLADRVGAARVFLAGYAALLVVYTVLLMDTVGWLQLGAYLALLGAYYAATDGVLMALASRHLDPALRASGLALLGTVVGVARLLSSLVFGLCWTLWGVERTVILFLLLLAVAVIIGGFIVLRSDRHAVAR